MHYYIQADSDEKHGFHALHINTNVQVGIRTHTDYMHSYLNTYLRRRNWSIYISTKIHSCNDQPIKLAHWERFLISRDPWSQGFEPEFSRDKVISLQRNILSLVNKILHSQSNIFFYHAWSQFCFFISNLSLSLIYLVSLPSLYELSSFTTPVVPTQRSQTLWHLLTMDYLKTMHRTV